MYTKLITCTARDNLWTATTNTDTCDYMCMCILMFLKGHAFSPVRKHVHIRRESWSSEQGRCWHP